MTEPTILTETQGRVGLIRLNRPVQLNALNDELMDALGAALLGDFAHPGLAGLAPWLGTFGLSGVAVVMAGAAMIGEEYGAWVCVCLPLIALGVAGLLAAGGRWHWGQVALFGLVVLVCSGFQLVLIGVAGASV
jgi:hypothetical protein